MTSPLPVPRPPRRRVRCLLLLLALAATLPTVAAPRPPFRPGFPPVLERLARDLAAQALAGDAGDPSWGTPPTPAQGNRLAALADRLASTVGTHEEGDAVMRLRDDARELGLALTMVQAALGPFLVLHERRDPARGWGMLVMTADRPLRAPPLLIEGPRPGSEPGTGERAARIFEAVDADVLLLGPVSAGPTAGPPPAADALRSGIARGRAPRILEIRALAGGPAGGPPGVRVSGTPEGLRLASSLQAALARAGVPASVDPRGSPGAGMLVRLEIPAARLADEPGGRPVVEALVRALGARPRE